jgi:hypothetical protein
MAVLQWGGGYIRTELLYQEVNRMIRHLKKSLLVLTAAGLALCLLLGTLFLISARPGGLGGPARIVVYSYGSILEINKGDGGYSEIVTAVENELRQTGKFKLMPRPSYPAGGLAEYLSENGTAAGLEIVYDEPVRLGWIREKNISRLFVDLDELLLFRAGADDGAYRPGAYALSSCEVLHKAISGLDWAGAGGYGIGNPGRIAAKYGEYIINLNRGEKGYDAILGALLNAMRETGHTGRFYALTPRDFPDGGLKGYLDDAGVAVWLELIYDEPVRFALFGKDAVRCQLIDLDEAAFYWAPENYYGLYRTERYSLSGAAVLHRAVAAFFADLAERGVTGYVTGIREDEILVVASALPGLAGKPEACWVKIPPGMSTPPALGQKVAVSFDRIIDLSYYPWVAVAAAITVLEPQAYPGARLTEAEAVGAALPLPEERSNYLVYRMVWAVKEITFDRAKGQWLLTFANGWDLEQESLVAIDDATAAAARLRSAFIITEDLLVNGVDLFVFHRDRDRVPGESVAKVVQTFGEPLSRGLRQKEASLLNPDYMVYWDNWVYQDIQFKLSAVRFKDEPEPAAPERLVSIYITGSQFETFRGIRVGDPLEKVFEKYGRAEIYDGRVSYGGDLLPFVQFVIENEKVTGIILTSGYITGDQAF